MTLWLPIRRNGGYLPIEDHGLIGDGATAALVGRDGDISWLCLPRFDSPPLFCGILDARRGGAFTVAPEDLVASQQSYGPDTGILVTEMRASDGIVRLTDAMTLASTASLTDGGPAGCDELLRVAHVLEGRVRLRIEISPRGGGEARQEGAGLRLVWPAQPDLHLLVASTAPLAGLRTIVDLEAGQRISVVLRWQHDARGRRSLDPDQLLGITVDAWRHWLHCFSYRGPQEPLVRRSAITLKMLDYIPNGAMVAAPTSSLPEAIGGPRNWDYRYAWIRDAAFSVYALRRIGVRREAEAFLTWVLDCVEKHGRPRVLYDLDGDTPPPEREDAELEGYRRSPPVRWGNAAAEQLQHDVYGEILDCAYQRVSGGGQIGPKLWGHLRSLVDAAAQEWRTPDHGIWEVRTPGRLFTYSAAMCQVALDRGARLADRLGLPGDVQRWRAEAERIQRAILNEAWDSQQGSLMEHLGGGGLDASLLTLSLRRVIEANHPKMVATTEAISRRLGAGNGLIYRYLPEESPDGLPGQEGAFLLCSFWLVDNLAKQGQLEKALDLYNSLCARANPLGLLPEQIDPATGEFLGNFPQAFSHVGLISSGVNLGRLMEMES